MNRYTLYCSEAQTKKAFELGAPIELLPNYTEYKGLSFIKCQDGNERPYIPPTAEQMIGWLEEQNLMFNITANIFDEYKVIVVKASSYETIANIKWHHNRKNAIIDGIDAALEYLILDRQ